jgi:hypothetical protein
LSTALLAHAWLAGFRSAAANRDGGFRLIPSNPSRSAKISQLVDQFCAGGCRAPSTTQSPWLERVAIVVVDRESTGTQQASRGLSD